MANSLRLVIGDKSLSSWSMRAWLTLKQSGLPFEEVLVPLDTPETTNSIAALSPSKKVPCLIHNDLPIWDSLAICEYIAELAPNMELWPRDAARRATARSYVAEMHSGVSSLRSNLSMDLLLKIKIRHVPEQTVAEIERIISLWEKALRSNGGPFLFGSFGIADAFFAPVVFRFLSYGMEIASEPALQYMKNVQQHPAVREWVDSALKERPLYQKFGEPVEIRIDLSPGS